MGCNCKWTEIIVAIIIFIAVIWPALLGSASKWIAAIAAIILFVHALMCKNCGKYDDMGSMKSPATSRKRR